MAEVKDIIPTFFVADVRKSIRWYETVLGFRTAFVYEEAGQPASYAGVEWGSVRIHLAQCAPQPGVVLKGACYLRLKSGIDELVASILRQGQPLVAALKTHDYGMREATVRDLDGNDVYIGQEDARLPAPA
jgi:uncharacterized glyoxalase superfamily protein PhnB